MTFRSKWEVRFQTVAVSLKRDIPKELQQSHKQHLVNDDPLNLSSMQDMQPAEISNMHNLQTSCTCKMVYNLT